MRRPRHVVLLLLLAVLLTTSTSRALAHPLGNFTVNKYSRIEVSAERIRVRYVMDFAEIPALAELRRLDTDRDREITEAEKLAYIPGRLAELVRNLHLRLGGTAIPLEVATAEVELVPGQGGLWTVRLSAWLEAPVGDLQADFGPDGLELDYRDDNEPDRLGWSEIVIRADAGVRVVQSTAPAIDLSDELRAYPADLAENPVKHVEARAIVAASHAVDRAPLPSAAFGERVRRASLGLDGSTALSEVVTSGGIAPLTSALALALAALWGAGHALSPGHGKTIVAAYLVGSRGTARHALFLGLTVTATHTIGIYALGLITLIASQLILPETMYSWLAVLSGLGIAAVGLSLLVTRARELAHGRAHSLGVPHHHHSHEHEHEHGHSHLPPGVDGRPVTWRSLLALGVAGGLLPCPSALVLLLGAIAVGRAAFGLALVAAFSLGLALVLTAIGIAFVSARRLIGSRHLRRPGPAVWLARVIPLASALLIAILGLVMALQAAAQTGLLRL